MAARARLREARVLSRSLIPTSPLEEAEETGEVDEVDDEVAKRRRVSDELGRLLGRVDSELSEEDKIIVERARRMERFFSQPFAVASAFTTRSPRPQARRRPGTWRAPPWPGPGSALSIPSRGRRSGLRSGLGRDLGLAPPTGGPPCAGTWGLAPIHACGAED